MKRLLITLLIVLLQISAHAAETRTGVWVTVFTPEKVLYSPENADRLITNCKNFGIDHIYLQIYRAGKAYYDSSITDNTPFKKAREEFGNDPVKYIVDKAHQNDIKVYAWINLLSLAHNQNADIIEKIGPGAVTLDQHERNSLGKKDAPDDLDKYYIREKQLFLEPGNKLVREYLVSISKEVISTYPSLDGLHLDYVRYPAVVPFSPGSRFDSHGISYGYTYRNMLNFKKAEGLDVKKMWYSRENYQKWDDWRRNNVTLLVKEISETVKTASPDADISCAVVPSYERAHSVNFQPWTLWIEKGLIDYVVTMNYTDDMYLLKQRTKSVLASASRDKIYIGLGVYLLKDTPKKIFTQIKETKELSPGGIVLFSYDEIAENGELRKILNKR